MNFGNTNISNANRRTFGNQPYLYDVFNPNNEPFNIDMNTVPADVSSNNENGGDLTSPYSQSNPVARPGNNGSYLAQSRPSNVAPVVLMPSFYLEGEAHFERRNIPFYTSRSLDLGGDLTSPYSQSNPVARPGNNGFYLAQSRPSNVAPVVLMPSFYLEDEAHFERRNIPFYTSRSLDLGGDLTSPYSQSNPVARPGNNGFYLAQSRPSNVAPVVLMPSFYLEDEAHFERRNIPFYTSRSLDLGGDLTSPYSQSNPVARPGNNGFYLAQSRPSNVAPVVLMPSFYLEDEAHFERRNIPFYTSRSLDLGGDLTSPYSQSNLGARPGNNGFYLAQSRPSNVAPVVLMPSFYLEDEAHFERRNIPFYTSRSLDLGGDLTSPYSQSNPVARPGNNGSYLAQSRPSNVAPVVLMPSFYLEDEAHFERRNIPFYTSRSLDLVSPNDFTTPSYPAASFPSVQSSATQVGNSTSQSDEQGQARRETSLSEAIQACSNLYRESVHQRFSLTNDYPDDMITQYTNYLTNCSQSPQASEAQLTSTVSNAYNNEVNRRNGAQFCKLCFKNRKPAVDYKNHKLKDAEGIIRCPFLRAYVCTICGITGDFAHTRRYCPLIKNPQASEAQLTSTVSNAYSGNGAQAQFCHFCYKNCKPAVIYKNHQLKDAEGIIRCPVLRTYVCTICGITGDFAHTRRYCPLNDNNCKFCHENGQNPDVYGSHKLKTANGVVECPFLRASVCDICGATGDTAHTRRYCPDNTYI